MKTDVLTADINSLRSTVVRNESLLQFDLLDCLRLQQFATARGVRLFGAESIFNLWKSGILRADAVWSPSSDNPLQLPTITKRDGGFLYSDTRHIPDFPNGLGGLFSHNLIESDTYQPYFHPFRYYVLYHVRRIFAFSISATQYLDNPCGFHSIVDAQIDLLSASENPKLLSQLFETYNEAAELSIIMEPSAYRAIFNHVRLNGCANYDQFIRELKPLDESLDNFIRKIGQDRIRQTTQDLCRNADLLDSNNVLHVLLRLMNATERLKVKSSLGGAILLRTMAEVLRRTTERALGLQLPEEDEIGFGEWMPGARKYLYGTERILDASPQIRRNFFGRLGLDASIKVRCYVEGATERGAFASAFSEFGSIEFIDLAGRVVQSGGKGLAFAQSLENDKNLHIFSVVCLDADRSDNLRTLRMSCANAHMFGRFFIANPNFEFANFSKSELFEIAQDLAIAEDSISQAHSAPGKSYEDFKNVDDLFKIINYHYSSKICKGEQWGTALMRYARKNPKANELGASCVKRPCIEVTDSLLYLSKQSYVEIEEAYTLNSHSGELEKR